MRNSTITTAHDVAGSYEIEVFDSPTPRAVIVCAHGNGVRRWDGERFFYNLAEHYPDRVFMLADQNQIYEDGCKLNDLAVMVARVQALIDNALLDYPDMPIIVLGHSMGCGIASRLHLNHVTKVIFVAPAAGDTASQLIRRYGPDVLSGQVVKTTDGLTKFITKEYVRSVQGIVWEQEYSKLLDRYKPVYVFESGDEEIVGDDRLTHRSMPFAHYKIIEGAKHNVAGDPFKKLMAELDTLL